MFKKISKKIKSIITTIMFVITSSTAAFAEVSEGSIQAGASQLFDTIFIFLAAIPGIIGIMNFFQAYIAYSESSGDNGNAQAAEKMSKKIQGGVIAIIAVIAVIGPLKNIAKSMFGF